MNDELDEAAARRRLQLKDEAVIVRRVAIEGGVAVEAGTSASASGGASAGGANAGGASAGAASAGAAGAWRNHAPNSGGEGPFPTSTKNYTWPCAYAQGLKTP